MSDLPEFAVVADHPCAECGCTTFANFFQRGPNIGGKCRDCGKERKWFSRFDLGLAKTKRARRGSLDRSEILAKSGHRCIWCGVTAATLQDFGEELVVGHIVPHKVIAKWPTIADHPANTWASCNACNDFAHRVGRDDFDLSMLLHAAVCYKAGLPLEGENENERGRENNDNPGSIRAEIRRPGLASIPLPGERQAPPDREGPARSDNGRADDPATMA